MRLIIRERAADDLEDIFDWIARDNPAAAVRMISRLREGMGQLLVPETTRMGRRGRVRGTRELLEQPYIIVYEVDDRREEVVVLSIVHTARDR
ncbi:MAG: type II toxin-antitoxin system RelE/ParE family toxin [Bauldia sp.]|nr:type II toxin-antitoxin system RelE/ParE family toxin [Bauldia sp.]